MLRAEIIQIALSRAGNNYIADVETNNSDEVKKAKLFYKQKYAMLLGKFPWKFCTNRVPLVPSEDPPPKRFSYAYNLPGDVKFIWDIYTDKKNLGVAYQGRNGAYGFTSLEELFHVMGAGSSWAELIDGRVETEYSPVRLFYTSSRSFDATDYDQEFSDILTREIFKELIYSKNPDTERLGLTEKIVSMKNDEDFQKASLESRKAARLPTARIVQLLREWS